MNRSRSISIFLSSSLLLRWALIALLGSASAMANAADTAEVVVKRLIEQVSTDLNQLYKQNRIGDKAALEQLIRTDILPSIDRQRLTQRVFRQYWSQITAAGKQADAQERVTNSLVRTYAVALSNYSGDTLTVVNVNEEGAKATAKTRIRRPNGQTIQVDFALGNTGGSLTLFNAIKPIWEKDGMEAALNAVSEVDVNKQ
jgi:ABC-type transporter MlaC component